MPSKVKVTMLGSSATGKTCYMVAMFSMMSVALNLNGFSLKTENRDEGRRLDDLWKAMINNSGDERWPPPNDDEPETYSFDLYYANKKLIVGFDWYDYRGGALRDYSTASDVEALQKRVRETTCLMICISGEYLTGEYVKEDNDIKLKALQILGINAMNALICDSSIGMDESLPPPPVVIVITKYDLCKHRSTKEIFSNIQSLFSPFFATGTKWLVMICPVTLGDKLATDLESGEVEPINVHSPVLFSLCADLLRQNFKLHQQQSDIKTEILSEKNSSFLGEWLKNRVVENDLDLKKQKDSIDKELDEIQKNLSLLLNKMTVGKDVKIFFNGQDVGFQYFFGT